MSKTRIKLTIQAPKIRKPVAKKANSVMKSKMEQISMEEWVTV